ncbi:hypothetical protein P9112_012302 [Eukaryota sp. TZLM1-RC]
MSTLHVPIADTSEAVSLSFSDLPPHSDVLDVLKGELSPLSLFQLTALQYLYAGKINEFSDILNVASSADFETLHYTDPKVFQQERVSVLISLASLDLTRLLASSSDDARAFFDRSCSAHLSTAESEDPESLLMRLCQAVFFYAKGDIAKARTHLHIIEQTEPHDIEPVYHYVSALTDLVDHKYKEGLVSLRKALVSCLEGKSGGCLILPFVYVLLSLCFGVLGDFNKARLSLQKSKEVFLSREEDLPSIYHLVYFYTDFLSHKKMPSREGFDSLSAALDLGSPSARIFAANCFIQQQRLQDASKLVRSEGRVVIDFNKAELLYLQGIVHQMVGQFSDAAKCFDQVMAIYAKHKQEHFGAMYAFGQVTLTLKSSDSLFPTAKKTVETLCERMPTSISVTRLLAHWHRRTNSYNKAVDLARKLTRDDPSNADNWALLGEVSCHVKDFVAALEAYEKTLGLLKYLQREVPYQLYYSLGVLQLYLCHNLDSTARFLSMANDLVHSKIKDINKPGDVYVHHWLHCQYALGVVFERKCDKENAILQFKKVLSHAPDYISCYIKLCFLSNSKATHYGLRWLKLGIYANPNSSDLMNEIGNFYHRNGDVQTAYETFKSVIEHRQFDSYAQLSKANIRIATIHGRDSTFIQTALFSALEEYKKVIGWRKFNLFAVVGLACILGYLGEYNSCISLLSHVREAQPVIIDNHFPFWVLLGHASVQNKDIRGGLRHYKKAETILKNTPLSELRCVKKNHKLGLIYQFQARALVNLDEYSSAVSLLNRAIKELPYDLRLVYDRSVCLLAESRKSQKECQELIKQEILDFSALKKQTEQAHLYAIRTQEFFYYLYNCWIAKETEDVNELGITKEEASFILSKVRPSMRKFKALADGGKKATNTAGSLRKAVEKKEEEGRNKLEEKERKLRLMEEAKEKKRQEEERLRLLEEEKIREQARKDKERLEKIRLQWEEQNKAKPTRGKGKKDNFVSYASEDESSVPVNPDLIAEMEERGTLKRRKSGRKTKLKKASHDSETDEEPKLDLGDEKTLSDLE